MIQEAFNRFYESPLPSGSEIVESELMNLKGLNVQVVGLGITGISVCAFLAHRGARVTVTDLRPMEAIDGLDELRRLNVRIICGFQDVKTVGKPDMVVVSPGVASDVPLLKDARAKGAQVISDIELATRFMPEPVLAVTGTNGKTTTTTLLARVLKGAGKDVFVGGNIGRPVIEAVESGKERDFSVLEVSSFHLETIADFGPHVAILLNITEDHLYRYKDFDDYAHTKFKIFANQSASDYALLNTDDPEIERYLQRQGASLKAKLVELRPRSTSTVGDGLYMSEDKSHIVLFLNGKEEFYPTAGFRLIGITPGGSNSIENIMAVIAGARIAGVSRGKIISSINGFTGLAHRMEFIVERGGVDFINDSKATNPASVVRALEGLGGPVILVAGGMDKGGSYDQMRTEIKNKVKLLLLFGEASARMRSALAGSVEIVEAGSFDKAVLLSKERAVEGDTVLLSPACSSFDEFTSFEERGRRFKTLVEAME